MKFLRAKTAGFCFGVDHAVKMAFRALEELMGANPEYAKIPFRKVEETQDPVYADKFDYYATPTFYVGDEKIFEAHIGLKYDQMKDEVEKVLKTAAEE